MSENLYTYDKIRKGLIACFYEYRRHLIATAQKQKMRPLKQEEEVGYASAEWDDVYERPVEQLMLYVATLIMLVGCNPAVFIDYLHKSIRDILEKYTLEELLQEVDEDSKSDLLYDLTLLGFINKQAE